MSSPNEGVLLDVEATVLDSGEGEAKLAANDISVKDFSAIADEDVSGLDVADGNDAGVEVAIDMYVDAGGVEGLVEAVGGERLFRVVGGLVDNENGGAGVEDDESLFVGREADVDSARPRLVLTWRGPIGGATLLIGIVPMDDVQVLASFVAVKERHGSILVRMQRLSASKEVGLGLPLGERWI